MMQHSKHSLVRLLPILALSSLLCGAAFAESPPADPVLAGVLEMLNGEISEEIILDWLRGAPRPSRPSATEMVVLKRAGASDDLLSHLLKLTQEPSKTPTAGAGPSSSAPPAALSATTSKPNPSAPHTEPAKASDEGVPVAFEFSYAPDFDEDEPEWDLFIYLDGEPLTLVPTGSSLFGGKALTFERKLAPGRHVLRLVQERHARRGRHRWLHLARAMPDPIELDLSMQQAANFALSFRQGPFKNYLNPITYRFHQGDEGLLQEAVGGDPEDWQPICEELQVNASDEGKLPRSLRGQLEDCIDWQDLWTGEVPSRDEVRRTLEPYRYRPVAE